MTTTRMNRCTHCGTVYAYHPSCYGMMPRFNDSDYCPDCAEIIERALSAVPVRFQKKWVDTEDYTREQIQEAQNLRMNKPPDTSGLLSFLPVVRVMPGLIDLKTNEVQNRVCERMPDPLSGIPLYYLASWWDSDPTNVEIKKEVWWNIENNCIDQIQEDYRN